MVRGFTNCLATVLLSALPCILPAIVTLGTSRSAFAEETSPPDWAHLPLPEPLLFDLALPLDTEAGRAEVNAIARVPTEHGDVLVVPEIEGTPWHGLGLELELPFEGDRNTGWSAALQATLGRPWRPQFVHGLQVILEHDKHLDTTEFVALYVPALRFSATWSTLALVGVRTPLDGDRNTRFVFNGNVFAQTGHGLTWGLELNLRADIQRTDKFGVIPQVHWVRGRFGLQGGVGFGHEGDAAQAEIMVRGILALRAPGS